MNTGISTEDFEQLSAYLDGELPDAQREALEQRLANESALAATLQALRAQQDWLRTPVHQAAAAAPIAEHLLARLQPTATTARVVPLRPRRGGYWHTRTLPRYAVAASLVAAFGLLLLPRWQHDAEQQQLAGALESLPSLASGWHTLEDGQRIRPLLSFPRENGQWCREYLLAEGGLTQHGVACRDSEADWQIQLAVSYQTADESTAYRPASAGDSANIANWIDAHASDIALGAREEAEQIARGWR